MSPTQPNSSGRQDPLWPIGAATRCVAVAALLFLASHHAEAASFNNLRFNAATSGNYAAAASLDSSDVNTGDFGANVTFNNVAIGASLPPQGQNAEGFHGSFIELAADVTRRRNASEYTVVPEITAAVVVSQLFPWQTTNGVNAGTLYTDQFWLDDPSGSHGNQELGFTWTPDPNTTLTFPANGKNNRNAMSFTFTPPNPIAHPIAVQNTFGPGSSQLQFNVQFPAAFGFNSDALYTMQMRVFLGSQVFIPGNNQTLPDRKLLVNIQPPGTVVSHPFGTFKVTNAIPGAQTYAFAPIPEPASAALFGLGGIALLGWMRWRRSHSAR